MRLPLALLRVLLIISLLVNGLGVAVAGAHGSAPAQTMATGSNEGPPCHGTEAMMPADAPATGHHQGSDHERPCSGIDCLRACAQQPALAVSALLLPVPAYGMAVPVAPLDPGRPAPPLPAISRPPIS